MIKISLPIPSSKLSPNARIHWSKKSKITKKHRHDASWIAFESCMKGVRIKSYKLTFFWPDKRRRDRDNASACCKAYLDGISDTTGQDDSEWEFNSVRFDIDRANPRLEIEFEIE